MHPLALRLAHAAGDTSILADLAWSKNAVAQGLRALVAGGTILADSVMVASGITTARLPTENKILCTLNDPRTAGIARELGTTRSAAAVELWRPHLAGAVVAIGNAPTALFHLLEMIAAERQSRRWCSVFRSALSAPPKPRRRSPSSVPALSLSR